MILYWQTGGVAKSVFVVGALAAALSVCARSHTLPPPTPISTAAYPGFVVECRNTSPTPMSRMHPIGALRLDGVVMARQGYVGSVLGGLPPDVAPDETFKHSVILQPGTMTRTSGLNSAGTGAMLQTNWAVPLSKDAIQRTSSVWQFLIH